MSDEYNKTKSTEENKCEEENKSIKSTEEILICFHPSCDEESTTGVYCNRHIHYKYCF